ncbi:MAG: ankyrin repeat domain-containing protein [Micavibrio sp.]|nr:ankyrin repeat domain-containing protein [Micavibrio sp.]
MNPLIMDDDIEIKSLDQLLTEAAFKGNRADTLTLLALGASPVWKDSTGVTALHYAAERPDSIDLLGDLLASTKANIDMPDDDGATPLFYAARRGNRDAAQLLLAKHAAVDARDRWQATPLCRAAHAGHTQVIATLLKAGADANAAAENGYTPLFYAVSRGHLAAGHELVRAGADAGLPNAHGLTPLELAQRLDQSITNQFQLAQFLAAAQLQKDLKNGISKPVKALRPARFKPKQPDTFPDRP